MVPPLERHYHRPVPTRGRLDKGALALLVDERLVLRAHLRTRLERARAAVARALLESKAYERAGYSNPRDYAREELGLSLRALQEAAQLDRLLSAFPSVDREVSSGALAVSRALEIAPVLTPETERAWLGLARKHTVLRLRRLVRAVAEQRASDPASNPTLSSIGELVVKPEADTVEAEADVTYKQRAPFRTRLLWEAYKEESTRASGEPVSDGQALEILLAEFWTLVPPAIAVRAREEVRSLPVPGDCDEEDEDEEEADEQDEDARVEAGEDASEGVSKDVIGSESEIVSGGAGEDPSGSWTTRHRWSRELTEMLERDPRRPAYLHELDRRVVNHACALFAQGVQAGLSPGDERLLDTQDLGGLGPHGLEHRYLAIRARLRRLAVDEGALLYLARNLRLYRALRYATFAHYTRDRLDIGRRTAEDHADIHRLLLWEPAVKRAWMRDKLSNTHLLLFRRLIRSGIRGAALRPWVRRAAEVTVVTFRDQVRFIEAARDGWRTGWRPGWRVGVRNGHPGRPTAPPDRKTWSRVRSELNLRPDLFVWLAHGSTIPALDGTQWAATPPEVADFRAGASGGAIAVAPEVADFRAETSGGTCSEDSPLVPSPAEPATRTLLLHGPPDVIDSYRAAVEAVRMIYGPQPAWWCLEVMVLHVRREWAAQNAYARRNTENYGILERDGFRCTAPGCTSRRELHVHHIRFASQGGSDDPENLTTLCRACHLFAVHRAGLVRVYGDAPAGLTWEMGFETAPDGTDGADRTERTVGTVGIHGTAGTARPCRTFQGEFRLR